MANYSLVVDSKFTPFTLEESLKPALLATEMHYDLEDKYNTLADTASGIEGLINPALDAELYERTKQYADDLNAQVELLSKEGLSPNLRRNLGTLKSRFASELAPIKTAYDNREKASKLVRELSIKDPSMIIERDPRTLSLKEFIDNPELDQGRYISGKDLSSRVAQAVQNAKKTIFANRPSAWNSIFGGQYYEKKNITGWTEQEINDAIAGKGPKELRDIVDNVLASSGITEWATPEQLEAARRYSNEGLWSGLGTTDYERVQNRAGTQKTDPQLPPLPLSKGSPFVTDVIVSKDAKNDADNIMQKGAEIPTLKNSYKNKLNSVFSYTPSYKILTRGTSVGIPNIIETNTPGTIEPYTEGLDSIYRLSPAFQEYTQKYNTLSEKWAKGDGKIKHEVEKEVKALQKEYRGKVDLEIEEALKSEGKNAVLHTVESFTIPDEYANNLAKIIRSKNLNHYELRSEGKEYGNHGSIKLEDTGNPITGDFKINTLNFSPTIEPYVSIIQTTKSSGGVENTYESVIPLENISPEGAIGATNTYIQYLKNTEESKAFNSLLNAIAEKKDPKEVQVPKHFTKQQAEDMVSNAKIYLDLMSKIYNGIELTPRERQQYLNIYSEYSNRNSAIDDSASSILANMPAVFTSSKLTK